MVLGASGHRGGFPRGGPRGPPRGQSGRGRSSGRSHEPLKFEGEFDFESANAQFDKDEIERELKEKLTLGNFLLLVFKDTCPIIIFGYKCTYYWLTDLEI